MRPTLLFAFLAFTATALAAPKLAGVAQAVQTAVDAGEISGAVTAVVTKDGIVDLQANGLDDIAAKKPMPPDAIFWIKSISKTVTGIAVLMLQDGGKLRLDDPVAKHLPEFAGLKTPSGKPANLTLAHLLTHTSGLGEAGRGARSARSLADIMPSILAAPMQFEPGERWKYTQAGIITAARVVELASGMPFDAFLEERLFGPLGMKDTGFYLTDAQIPRVAMRYRKNRESGALEPESPRTNTLLSRERPPMPNDGLYSTAADLAQLAQMLLRGGELGGRRYLKPETVELLRTPRTGDLKAGFTPGCAWGVGCGVVVEPQGVSAALSKGSFGHGGGDGTQLWIDPVKGAAYVLMIQRTSYGTPGYRNADDTKVRADFQQAAAQALK